jgi:hypothetical protein
VVEIIEPKDMFVGSKHAANHFRKNLGEYEKVKFVQRQMK